MELLLPEFGLFFWTLISFLLFFFLLKKFAWKPILGALNERESNIAESIATAERVKKEMAEMSAENEKVLNEARAERSQILREAKEAKDKIVSEAEGEAKDKANKIISDARQQIQNEKMAALTDVKNQVGNLVIEVSEKVLRSELKDKEAQEGYISKLASEIQMN
jgi:F-type H+-transporting ATPase subunit b